MAVEWFYRCMGVHMGPYTAAEFRQRALAGEITHDTLVTRSGTDDWVTADRVKGLLLPPLPHEMEKNESISEIIDKQHNTETLTTWNNLSPKERDNVIKVVFFTCFLLALIIVCIPRTSQKNTSTPDPEPISDFYRNNLNHRIDEIEARTLTTSPTDQESIKKLMSDLDSLESDVRRSTSTYNRKPYERGYTLEQRKEASRRTLIDQGYSESEATQTVEDMERYDLLLDPPRR